MISNLDALLKSAKRYEYVICFMLNVHGYVSVGPHMGYCPNTHQQQLPIVVVLYDEVSQ